MNLILSILVEGHIKARGLIYDQEDLQTIRDKVLKQALDTTPGKWLRESDRSPIKGAVTELYNDVSPLPSDGEERGGAASSGRGAKVSAREARRGRGNEGQTALLKQELRYMKELMEKNQAEMAANQKEMKRREELMEDNQKAMMAKQEEIAEQLAAALRR